MFTFDAKSQAGKLGHAFKSHSSTLHRRPKGSPTRVGRSTSQPLVMPETLEDRRLMSATFVVTSAADAVAGPLNPPGLMASVHDLRWAISQVNADKTAGTDTIKFAIGSGNKNITLVAGLSKISHSVVIDGTSQPGGGIIHLDGSRIPGATGLDLAATGSTIKGLAIDNVDVGIRVEASASGAKILSNVIGQNSFASPIDTGIYAAAPSVQISGNRVCNGDEAGIVLDRGSSFDTVSNNVAERNATGVMIAEGSNYNVVSGNTVAASYQAGIEVQGQNNTIGGTVAGSANVLGMDQNLDPSNSNASATRNETDISVMNSGNKILGNNLFASAYFGIDLEGTTFANGEHIAANNTVVQGNTIQSSWFAGINVNGVSGTLIGGVGTGANNIWNSGRCGIDLGSGSQNTIEGNSIFSNTGLGITLESGANDAQSAPVITSAVNLNRGTGTVIAGTCHGKAGATVRVEFFSSDAGSANQGRTFLGFVGVTLDVHGNGVIQTVLPATTAGQVLTATVTNPVNVSSGTADTSAFSSGVAIQQQPYLLQPFPPIHLK